LENYDINSSMGIYQSDYFATRSGRLRTENGLFSVTIL